MAEALKAGLLSNIMWNTRYLASAKDEEVSQNASMCFFPLSLLVGLVYFIHSGEMEWEKQQLVQRKAK